MTRARLAVLNPVELARRCRRSHLAPSPDLEPFIAVAWMLEWDLEGAAPHTQRVVSNPCVQIVVDEAGARLMGVVTGPFAVTLSGRGFVFGLRFRAGGFRPFWPGPVAELTDRTLPLREAMPEVDVEHLRQRAACADGEGILNCLEAALRSRGGGDDARAGQVRAIAERIADDGSLLTVEQVAAEFGLRVRTLQRLFRNYVGVSPKWLIRRYRMQEAAARAEAGEAPSWSELAYRLGYFDQAHLVNDFTRMIGVPPEEYVRSLRRG